ncbi:MAG: AraC family transcriptional regulator [Ruminococcus sp.]
MIIKEKYRENQLIDFPPLGEKYENVSVTCSLCREQMIHMHDCLEIIYVFSGQVEVKVSFERFSLSPGEFIAINQYDVHAISAVGEDALIATVHISDTVHLADDGFIVWWPEALKYDSGIYWKQAGNIRALITQYAGNAPERIIMISVNNIIRTFLNELKVEAFPRNGRPADYSENELLRIHSMYIYMYEHLDERLTLDKMASDFAISTSYLSHYIKAVLGDNYQNALNIMRCERAETDILGSRLPIYEISDKYGFSSSRYFAAVFRKYFGYSPAEYRKKYLSRTISHSDNEETVVENILDYLDDRRSKGRRHSITLSLNLPDVDISIISNVESAETIDHLHLRDSRGAVINVDGDETVIIIKKA